MVNLFSFGCHVINRAYVRTYASIDCKGGVGETIDFLASSSSLKRRKYQEVGLKHKHKV